MENFSKWVLFMGAVFNHVLRWIVMKKDCELPWVIRIGRWTFVLLGIFYAAGFVAKSFLELFG